MNVSPRKKPRLDSPAPIEPANDRGGGPFRSRPSRSVIDDCIRHVKLTGQPHTWAWHRHDAPPKSAKPVLLEKIYLPEASMKKPELWGRCPLCAPNHPKFRWGYLVWFPIDDGGDGCLRVIGHDCGSRFFGKDEYRQALAVFGREQDEAQDRAYLVEAAQNRAAVIEALESLTPWAVATEDVRRALRKALPSEFIKLLISSNGSLFVTKPIRVLETRADGSTYERRDIDRIRVGAVRGYEFLANGVRDIEEQHENALELLRKHCPPPDRIPDLDAASVAIAVKALRSASRQAIDAHDKISSAIAFLSAESISALQIWSSAKNSEASARIVSQDAYPKLAVYRYKKREAPHLGMRETPDVVAFHACLRQPRLPPLPVLDRLTSAT